MPITDVQLIYRLQDTVRVLINYRDGVDSFNLYWSATEGGAYTLFAEGILNEEGKIPSIKNKALYDFNPSTITIPTAWDNNQTNFIKLAPVTNGTIGALEGPMKIPTRLELINQKDQVVAFGFNKDSQKFIPLAVNEDGELKTV